MYACLYQKKFNTIYYRKNMVCHGIANDVCNNL